MRHDRRRAILTMLAVTGVYVLPAQRVAAAFPVLNERSPEARRQHYHQNALKVTHPHFHPGQSCHACRNFNRIDFGCPVFPRNSVKPSGWCQRWQSRQG